jgi:hypothetical protein
MTVNKETLAPMPIAITSIHRISQITRGYLQPWQSSAVTRGLMDLFYTA